MTADDKYCYRVWLSLRRKWFLQSRCNIRTLYCNIDQQRNIRFSSEVEPLAKFGAMLEVAFSGDVTVVAPVREEKK